MKHMGTKPNHIIYLTDTIISQAICRNEAAYNLICVAFESRLSLLSLQLPEENGDEFNWKYVQDIELLPRGTRCHLMTFSPDTSLVDNPKSVTICAAVDLCELRIYYTDLAGSTRYQLLKDHTAYINDISWVCGGRAISSVSDDCTCKFWKVEKDSPAVTFTTFSLISAAVAVRPHPTDPEIVLVAEKQGFIHIYNVLNNQSMFTVRTPNYPLMSVDWRHTHRSLIVAMADRNIFIYDMNRPPKPVKIVPVHEDIGRIVRLAPDPNRLMFASVGSPNSTMKVMEANSTDPVLDYELQQFSGLDFHQKLPYIVAPCDRRIFFWKLNLKSIPTNF
ncbi:nucleoporin Nup37-like [Scaptodrosophila lebanonensis]|uniref:Nucleoporin Nup37-like n=1 Tax=Drosophila lebanonensis TaxID=7225 RepID=A0A6J2TUF2_DROLE|nr:nucleoporin Nup37-like [Scaptodrosophila lebanonensis]